MQEEWKPIEGYEAAYEVSNFGRVRSLRRQIINNGRPVTIKGMLLNSSTKSSGYPSVTLWADGISKRVRVHRLVAKAFVPGEADGLEVCHNDGNKDNNHYLNLRWDTRRANVNDMRAHGTLHYANVTHCPSGHPYDAENTIVSGTRRACRTCRNALRRRRRRELSKSLAARAKRDAIISEMSAAGHSQQAIADAVEFTQAGVCAALKRIARERAVRASQVVQCLPEKAELHTFFGDD